MDKGWVTVGDLKAMTRQAVFDLCDWADAYDESAWLTRKKFEKR